MKSFLAINSPNLKFKRLLLFVEATSGKIKIGALILMSYFILLTSFAASAAALLAASYKAFNLANLIKNL